MFFDDFSSRLDKDDLAHLILLYGTSESVISEGFQNIRDQFKKTKPGGTLQVFDGAEHSLSEMISTAQTSGLFSTTQLLIFKNAQKVLGGHSEAAMEQLKEYGQNPNPDSYLLFLAPGMKKTVKAVSVAERLGWAVQCSDMPEWKLMAWVKKQAQSRGLSISDEATQWLIQKMGNEMAYLKQALEQLVDYIYPEKAITREHVRNLAVPGIESEIFPFLDAVALRQTEKALKLIGQLPDGIDVGTTMMLYGRMRELLLVAVGKNTGLSQSQAAEQLGLHPFRLKNLWEQSNQFTVGDLKQALQDLIHIQAGIVTGRLGKQTPAILLEWWVLKWGKNQMALR